MALTDEQIEEIWKNHVLPGFGENQRFYSPHVYARAIESAACAERDALIAKLRLEAQIHAQEARTANATIAEIYQAVTDSTGEPGNWNGAAPVKARIAELERQLAEARKDAARYRWAVSVCESDGFGYWLPEVCLKEGHLPPSKEEADAAIDNAMQKG